MAFDYKKVRGFVDLAVETYDDHGLLLFAARLVDAGDHGSFPPTGLRPTGEDWPETVLLKEWSGFSAWEKANSLYYTAKLLQDAAERRATYWVKLAREQDDAEAST